MKLFEKGGYIPKHAQETNKCSDEMCDEDAKILHHRSLCNYLNTL